MNILMAIINPNGAGKSDVKGYEHKTSQNISNTASVFKSYSI